MRMRPIPVIVIPRVVPSQRAAVPPPVEPRVPAPIAVVIVAVIPRVESPTCIDKHGTPPRSEHGGYVLRFDPNLIAHYHYVVERRIVGACVPVIIAETVGVVA